MGKYDTGSKKIVNVYNQAWAEWVLQQQNIEVETELSGEFQFIARSNDSLLKVKGEAGQFLVLTELQFIYDRTMPERLAAYKLLAYQRYDLDVYVVVVYFLPPSEEETIVAAYHNEFMDQLTHIDFQVIKLWELEAEQVVAYDNPMLLPFTPLMRGGATEQMVRRCAGRIRQEPQAAELEVILTIFAGYVLDIETIRKILRWEMPIVQESPIIQELLKQERQTWLKEGLEQGLEKGERKAALKALSQTLTIRFKIDLKDFTERLEKLTATSLQKLNEIALTVDAPAQFEEALTRLSAEENPERS